MAAFAFGSAAAQSGTGDVIFKSGFDELPNGPRDEGDAARFLRQSTFGATPAEITRLMGMSFEGWIDEQMARAPTLHRPYVDAIDLANGVGTGVFNGDRVEAFGYRALTAPDQLRQRVAYALSQIFVVSAANDALGSRAKVLTDWQDFLLGRAFGNYATLLRDVTLSPTMGVYLSHRGNQKPDPANNVRPDENYAREIMQLFSVGLVQLAPDGTVIDGNPAQPGVQPVPTYNQDTVRGFAYVFTGWNYATCTAATYVDCGPGNNDQGFAQPMTAFAAYHASAGTKQLLVYPNATPPNGVLAAGGTAQSDLDAALANIVAHPNVAPFISRALIQQLTTSNPTPAYVQRVAAVFADDNGAAAGGVRGNLGAVVKAILLDVEARDATQAPPYFGKLREPQLRWMGVLRALGARSDVAGRYDDGRLRFPYAYLGQGPLEAPTVFNFYLPSYMQRGELASASLRSPEFQILTDGLLTTFANELSNLLYWTYRGNEQLEAARLKVDFGPYYAMSDNPAALVDRFNVLLMGGTMSSFMRTTLIAYIDSVDRFELEEQRRQRVQDLVWLITMSPEGAIER